MKKMFLKVLPFVAALIGFDPKAKEKIEFSAEDKEKLEKETGMEGFAEAFQKYYNEEYLAENQEAQAAFQQFMQQFNAQGAGVETAEEDPEEEPAASLPEGDEQSLSAQLRQIVKAANSLLKTNAQQAADLEKLKTDPEPDEPAAVIPGNQKSKTVKHTNTHLFGSGNSWDAMERPWNRRAAEASLKGEIGAATVWDKVNIDKLNEDLGAYSRRNATEIMSLLMDGYDIPSHWTVVNNIQDEYVFASIVTGEITQGFKKSWLPKNKQRFVPIKNKIFDKQIDITWQPSELKSIEKSWLNMFFNEGSTPYKMSFARYLIGELMKKARKEDKITIFKGVHYDTANLPEGVSGGFMNAMDGFLKIVSDNRGNTYQAHALGKPTIANIYDYVNNFVMQLPYDFRSQAGLVFGLSDDWHKAYHNARELKKATNTDYTPNDTTVDQYPNIRFEAHAQLNGSDFMYVTTEDNIGLMVDRPGEESMLTLELNRRAIDAFADYKLGVFFKAFGANVDPNAALTYEDQIFFSNDVSVLDNVYTPVASNDATPSVADHHALKIGSNNTAATDITSLDDVVEGQRYFLFGDADANISTVKNGANIILAGGADFALNKGNLLELVGLSGGKVIEYKRTEAGAVPEPEKVVLAADATTADAADGTHFITQDNTGATALTNILNAVVDEIYTLEGGSDTNSTTVANGGNFLLTGAFTASDGAFLKVQYNGTRFVEVDRG